MKKEQQSLFFFHDPSFRFEGMHPTENDVHTL